MNVALQSSGRRAFEGILEYCDEECVSIDFKGNPHSSIVDALSTKMIGWMLKVLSWYDNEWGFSCRMRDLAKLIASKGCKGGLSLRYSLPWRCYLNRASGFIDEVDVKNKRSSFALTSMCPLMKTAT